MGKLACVVTLALAATTALPLSPAAAGPGGGVNKAACRPSTAHPNPVVFLHGTWATHYEDINLLQSDVASKGYCTYSETYGAYRGFPFVGGLKPSAESAAQIKGFILEVLAKTGAQQVDLVGHSEGAFQALYVTKTQGIAAKIGKVIALAPPTHGLDLAGFYTMGGPLGQPSRDLINTALRTVGCSACPELMADGSAVATLNQGPIAQPGVAYTIITSRSDEMVTPTAASFVWEAGVTNRYLQDFCPENRTGHIAEAYDPGIWDMIENALDPAHTVAVSCTPGVPL